MRPPASPLSTRDWHGVRRAISDAVVDSVPLPGDFDPPVVWQPPPPSSSPSSRVTWLLSLAYLGDAFSGFAWQKNSPKPTVEGCLQDALRPLLDGRSELRLACAGRTDAGVSATGQLVSFYAPASLDANSLRDALASPELRLVGARRMCRGYHATYSTAWRRYAYFLPAETEAASVDEAARLDALLRPLGDGVARDYAALGRGVPAGKETRMLVRHAAARPVRTRAGDFVTRVDLVGDRWLRRQVRSLVATAVELADDGGDDDRRLLDAAASGVPERTAPHEAPALGLVLAEAGAADELDLEWRFGAERLCNSAELDRRLHYPLDPPDKAAAVDLRVNTLRGATRDDALRRLRAAGFAAAPTAASPLGVRIEPPVAVGALLEAFDGDVEPMDEGAQLVTALVGARAGESVALWGAGAAGGKALALAAAMENKGKLLVVDGDETRLAALGLRLRAAGVDNAQCHAAAGGGTAPDPWLKRKKRSVDRVLVDAPCSGGGLRRRDDGRRCATPPLEELLEAQAAALERAARLVRPGGTLVYATSSVNDEENDGQVARFLASEPGADFELAPPEGFHVKLDGAYLRPEPGAERDGYFAAVLRRQEGGWSR